jgi:hypothetical protein
MHPSGLAVDVHSSSLSIITYTGLYYRLDNLDAPSGTVDWGPSRRWIGPGTAGLWPSVAITSQGYVILTYSNAFTKNSSRLYYSVGTLDPNGSNSQEIQFKLRDRQFDKGFQDAIAVNDNGSIAEVHEANGKTGLWYRLEYLNAPGAGDFSIVWNTGDGGIQYDDGINPKIAINDNDDAVEVHQVTGEYRLPHTRGRIVKNHITFTNVHPLYIGGSTRPSVVLLDNGHVIEIHASNETKEGAWEIRYRTGILDPNVATHIQWSPRQGGPADPLCISARSTITGRFSPRDHHDLKSSGAGCSFKCDASTGKEHPSLFRAFCFVCYVESPHELKALDLNPRAYNIAEGISKSHAFPMTFVIRIASDGDFSDFFPFPEDPIDRCGWNVEEGVSDMLRAQAAAVEDFGCYRTFLTIRELVEERIALQTLKGKFHDGRYFLRGHNRQGKPADDSSYGVGQQMLVRDQPGGVPADDSCLGKTLLQQVGEPLASLDEHQILLRYAFLRQPPRKNARTRAQLQNRRIAERDLTGHNLSERKTGRRNRRHL